MDKPLALEDRAREGAKRFSPSAARNREVIGETLSRLLPQGARVLEIASGTGEHAAHMVGLRPDLVWQTSDPDADSRASQDAWATDAGGRILPSLALSTTAPLWWEGLSTFDALFCANMIHIAPWRAAQGLAEGAAHLLAPSGLAILYGPFLDGERSTEGNMAFDASLRGRDPEWGVRELAAVKALFAKHGLGPAGDVAMPANNRVLVFAKPQRAGSSGADESGETVTSR